MAKFTQEVISLAQQTEAKYGVPASVTLAQYGLETGYGTSELAMIANNYFGISGKNVNTGKFVMRGGRAWAKYDSMAASFDDHGRLLSSDLYASKTAGAKNAFEYVDAIAEIYAPSSDGNTQYAARLKNIIAANNLTMYDSVTPSGFGDRTGGGFSSNSGDGFSDRTGGGFSGNSGAGFSGTIIDTPDGSVGVATGVDTAAAGDTLMGKVIKFVALLLIGVLAAVFFFSAFEIKLNPKQAAKEAVVKAVADNV